MKNIILSVCFIMAICISCHKSDSPDPTGPPAAVEYMSITAGSTWNYELVDNKTATTRPFTLTATDKDSTINNKAYRIFTNSIGANEYNNISGEAYFNFRNLPEALGGSSVEYLYLKDNAAVGASWNQSYPIVVSGVSLTAILTNTITAKGLIKTVKSVSYNDVIHVTTTVAVTLLGIPLPSSALTTDIQTFYAPKTGMIQTVNKIHLDYAGFTNDTDQQTNLNSANIK